MKHEPRERLQTVADVHADMQGRAMTRGERLAHWAELLEKAPDQRLSTLWETEYQPAWARDAMRSAGSPITVAFEDPLLRAEGLQDDTYGEAKRFFELTDWELHQLVCSCHSGGTVRAEAAARCVREILEPRPSLFAMLLNALLIVGSSRSHAA
ncbi:hypothetical protein PYH37_006395 (plasmid) [Sinorhizobium numidicum]|uniref:Uncharacterized protein n=1 Tax=Sinorhizobium numidicum TaxID=680248 RepID=A0ABY8D7S2_9HYPH|nr:hypothetical protein [Sinorhizobium numidicum]WEX79474.1 hypothetical protein PYH37_006395 [Sinorhizobium numidicum]WEX85570.1 hypothetical protein PYH38_005989 [Sinorhizobium numidicum]